MTYRELQHHIDGLNAEQLEQDVTIFEPYTGEYMPIVSWYFSVGSDVIDDNHLILCLKA